MSWNGRNAEDRHRAAPWSLRLEVVVSAVEAYMAHSRVIAFSHAREFLTTLCKSGRLCSFFQDYRKTLTVARRSLIKVRAVKLLKNPMAADKKPTTATKSDKLPQANDFR